MSASASHKGAVVRPGRGLISPYPESDRGKLDEGEVIGSELVITGGNTPALFDLVKEPLDQVTSPERNRFNGSHARKAAKAAERRLNREALSQAVVW